MEKKLVVVMVNGIALQIAKDMGGGYTEGILETFLPDDDISEEEAEKWTLENNKRMKSICDFLNKTLT